MRKLSIIINYLFYTVAGIALLYGVIITAEEGEERRRAIECNELEKWEEEFEDFYYVEWQKEMCEK